MFLQRVWLWRVALALTLASVGGTAAARLPDDDQRRLDEGTALTVGAQTVKLGVLSFDYGIIERLSVGTDPPFWAFRAATSVWIPNVHLKFAFINSEWFWLSAQAGFYYADITHNGASGSVTVVPISGLASVAVIPGFWIHGDVTYDLVTASGAGDLDRAAIGGSAGTRAVQLGALLEWRLAPVFAITLRGRLQVYSGRLAFSGTAQSDEFTTGTVDARLTPRRQHPWVLIPGVAFLWRHVHLQAGLGYGTVFVPGVDIPLTKQTWAPDFSLAVLF
jgi:hypothetical protein